MGSFPLGGLIGLVFELILLILALIFVVISVSSNTFSVSEVVSQLDLFDSS